MTWLVGSKTRPNNRLFRGRRRRPSGVFKSVKKIPFYVPQSIRLIKTSWATSTKRRVK